jgi:predicted lipoprotein with Yx(FWY)xxD motif
MPRTSAASTSVLVISIVALTACSAIENKKTSSSAASTTQTSVTAPRTEPVTAPPNPPPSSTEKPPTGDVSLAIDDRDDLGEVVVDSTRRTVYAFSEDAANEPACDGECSDTWPPLLAKGDPAGTIGVEVAAVKTVPRRDGGNQVTYKGIPLYYYAGDNTDKDANGQGLNMFGGEWHVLTKDGQPLA